MSWGYLHAHTLLFPTPEVCREVEVAYASSRFLVTFLIVSPGLVSHRVKRTLRVEETRNAWYAIRRAARKAVVQRAFDP